MANNNALYDAVLAGAGGAAQSGWLISTNAGDYVSFVVDVDILAVAVDLQIPTIAGGPSISQIGLLQSITEGVLSARYPIPNIPTTYIDIGKAIATLFNALSLILTNNPSLITNILAGTNISVSIVNKVATISSISAVWNTVFDMDLAALPTSWSNADGIYAMGGFNWTKYGTAKQRGGGVGDFFGIENGVGFRTQTASAALPITQSINNRPYLTLQLAQVIPNFTVYTPVRFSWISTVGGCATNTLAHFAGFSIQEDTVPFRINWTQQQVMNNNPAVASSYSAYSYSNPSGTSSIVNAETDVAYINRRIMRMTMKHGFAQARVVYESASGIIWPLETDWLWIGEARAVGTAAVGTTSPLAPLAGLRNAMFIELGAGNNGFNLPGPWFSKLKLEAFY